MASSTSSSNANGSLGIQRTYSARTRSVDAELVSTQAPTPTRPADGPLIDRAGYFPKVRWTDPEDPDEETEIVEAQQDSQAKWKPRRRAPGKVVRFLRQLETDLLVVGVPSILWYIYLIKTG